MTLAIAQTHSGKTISLVAKMANRHGLIAGATGTGKTVTLRKLAEAFSDEGVPVFLADVKGDLSGISQAGSFSGKIAEPNVDLDLVAKNVSFDAMKLQSLTAKGQVKTEKNIQGDVNLDLRQFNYNDIKLDQAQLAVKGSEGNHQLQLTSKGNPVGANLQISGKFDRLHLFQHAQL